MESAIVCEFSAQGLGLWQEYSSINDEAAASSGLLFMSAARLCHESIGSQTTKSGQMQQTIRLSYFRQTVFLCLQTDGICTAKQPCNNRTSAAMSVPEQSRTGLL